MVGNDRLKWYAELGDKASVRELPEIAGELLALRQSIKEAVGEIESAEKKYEKQYYAGERLNSHPIEYTEGLVSGYKSAWIYLHKHNLVED